MVRNAYGKPIYHGGMLYMSLQLCAHFASHPNSTLCLTNLSLSLFPSTMKVSLFYSATLFSLATFAFPASLLKKDISAEQLAEITALVDRITKEAGISTRLGARASFDAEAQHVSTTGDHAYVSLSSYSGRCCSPTVSTF